MQVVKLKLFQNMVNYRMEMSFGYVQSYPLPTPSMVRGMVHSLLGAREYHPLKMSIQGQYESVVTNMQKVYKFDRDRKARPDNPYDVEVGTSVKTAKHGLMFVDLLVNVELVLHIAFENTELHNKLYEAALSKTLVLGRNEDIARIDVCEIVELDTCDERIEIPYNMYVSEQFCAKKKIQSVGTMYRLPFKYASVESFNDKRIFEFVNARFFSRGNAIEIDDLDVDNENNPVIMLEL